MDVIKSDMAKNAARVIWPSLDGEASPRGVARPFRRFETVQRPEGLILIANGVCGFLRPLATPLVRPR
ncbi:hypothetical protein [Allosphingosinicella vermicomposti]|uniref:hypothetical protein n=1 Tax=Allosphingosinicella vermicomposti TaxID=614671 RepID=UPI001A9C70D9|nr:hypothetical protein [Allosphingosinicella vermicomposti]